MRYCYHSVNVIKFIRIDQVPNLRMSWKALFRIIRLLLSLYLGPKVITLSGFHCISNMLSSLFDQSFICFSFGLPYLRNTFQVLIFKFQQYVKFTLWSILYVFQLWLTLSEKYLSITYFQVSTICQVHSLTNLLYVSALVDLIWEIPF
jgi:hypothetical protein